MTRRLAMIGLAGVAITAATWLALAVGLGNVGLQRSVSIGPHVLVFDYAIVLIVVLVIAVAGAALTCLRLGLTVRQAVALLVIVVLIDVLGSWLARPRWSGS